MPTTDLVADDEALTDAELDHMTTPPAAAEQDRTDSDAAEPLAGSPAIPAADADPQSDSTSQSDDITQPDSTAQADVAHVVVALDDRLNVVDIRLAELAELLGAAGDRGESALAQVELLTAAGSRTADRVVAVEGRLDSAAAGVSTTQQQLASVTEQLASVSGRLDSAEVILGALDERLGTLQSTVSEHGRAVDEVTRTIATEVERYTTDALVESRHSVQLAVNSMAQLSLAMAESSRDLTEDLSAESATALLDSFRVDLDAVLGQLGFVALETAVGSSFDPRRHRALKRVPTSDPAQDKVITRVIRDGYLSASTGRILLFADVEVSRHRP